MFKCVSVCMIMQIGKDILKVMHEHVLVYMLVTVFTLCLHNVT